MFPLPLHPCVGMFFFSLLNLRAWSIAEKLTLIIRSGLTTSRWVLLDPWPPSATGLIDAVEYSVFRSWRGYYYYYFLILLLLIPGRRLGDADTGQKVNR